MTQDNNDDDDNMYLIFIFIFVFSKKFVLLYFVAFYCFCCFSVCGIGIGIAEIHIPAPGRLALRRAFKMARLDDSALMALLRRVNLEQYHDSLTRAGLNLDLVWYFCTIYI